MQLVARKVHLGASFRLMMPSANAIANLRASLDDCLRKAAMRTTFISLFACTLTLFVSAASARPQNEIETIYYASDARRPGEEVGRTVLNCSGPFEREGVSSPYFVRYTYPCNQLAACSTEDKDVACSADLCDRMKASQRCKGTGKK